MRADRDPVPAPVDPSADHVPIFARRRTAAPVTTIQLPAGESQGRGVRRLTEPVSAHILDADRCRRYAAFASFRCGEDGDEAAREVELTASRLLAGTTNQDQTPVVVEDSAGGLLGFCSVHRRPLAGYDDGGDRPWIAERYVVAVGRALSYRGLLLRDNATTAGMVALRAGLDMIALEAGDGPMPSVSALVLAENARSRRVFEDLGFICLPEAHARLGQDLLVRPSGVPLPEGPDRESYLPPTLARPASPVALPGRNDPCPCGSGRKFKRCHGR